MAAVIALAGGLAWAARHDFRPAEYSRLDWATLIGFTLDDKTGSLSDIPAPLRALDGHRVEVRGLMIPIDSSTRITCFAVIPRFGRPPPMVHEAVIVRLVTGKCVEYSPDPILVRGTFRVRVERDDEYLVSVYEITADSVTVALKS